MKPKEIFMYALGAFIVGCAVTTVLLLIFFQLPEKNHDIVNISVGALLGMAMSVVAYFYGSSKGSADKTALLNQRDETKAP